MCIGSVDELKHHLGKVLNNSNNDERKEQQQHYETIGDSVDALNFFHHHPQVSGLYLVSLDTVT